MSTEMIIGLVIGLTVFLVGAVGGGWLGAWLADKVWDWCERRAGRPKLPRARTVRR